METTFEQGDKDALAFIDTQDTIKHLEEQGYQVIDKSEHGDVLKRIEYLEACLDASLSQNEEAYSLIRNVLQLGKIMRGK